MDLRCMGLHLQMRPHPERSVLRPLTAALECKRLLVDGSRTVNLLMQRVRTGSADRPGRHDDQG